LETGDLPVQVDHKDRNRTNNKWDNLRPSTQSQNNRNGPGKRRKNTWLKGVGWRPKGGRWFATINMDSQRVYLGTFDSEQEAHEAYCAAAIRLHGEFANFERGHQK
jgi:hypothetical protein